MSESGVEYDPVGPTSAGRVALLTGNGYRVVCHTPPVHAAIGDGAAIAEMGAHHHELDGHVAFATWLGVHAWLMSRVRQRIEACRGDVVGSSRSSSIIDDPATAQIDWGDKPEEEP